MELTIIKSINHKTLKSNIAVDNNTLKTQEELCIEHNLLDDQGCDWNPEDMGYITAETPKHKVYYLTEDKAYELEDFAKL